MNKTIMPVTVVYTPEAQIRRPAKLLASMWQDLKASRELSWRLFVRDVSARYRQSLLGVLWAFMPPLITSAIFIVLQSKAVINFGETSVPYPVYVLVGTLLWQLFADALNAPLRSVTAAKSMLAKINFPREALIVSAVYLVLFDLLIKLGILAIIFVLFRLQPTWALLLAPVPMLTLVILGIAAGLLLTPLGVLYTDIATSLPVIVQLLFFVTPVVYTPPDSFPFSIVAYVNPVSPPLIAARDLITTGTVENVLPLLVVTITSLFVLFIAWVIYRIAMPIIIERMSA
ncbi:MAG: ABC transporter permease [Anaerolineae bacterium]|nr:ABC transporter permease [Anaerolineae bacterium]